MEQKKYDAKPTYKKLLGYRPGVAVIGDLIVGIIRNFYKAIIQRLDVKKFGLNATSRIKANGFGYTGIVYFVLRFFHLYGIYRTPSNSNNNRLASNPPP